MSGYKRLTPSLRYQIQVLKESEFGVREIAKRVKVSPSSISRELRRCDKVYVAEVANEHHLRRMKARSEKRWKIRGARKLEIEKLLRQDWSPEQIARFFAKRKVEKVSFQTIYRHVEREKLAGGKLFTHLRILRRLFKDRKRPKYQSYRGFVRNRKPISARAKIVEKRSRIGDYERDLVYGIFGGRALLTIVDRKTRYVHIACVESKKPELVHRATVRLLKDRDVYSITNDNGVEFAFHEKTTEALAAPVYFSRAYASWERGSNENLNGLLRQYHPKQREIQAMTSKQLRALELRLNLRPRKVLGDRTPYELYHGHQHWSVLR